jgi:O-antigen/teichoic acid export membrane protein
LSYRLHPYRPRFSLAARKELFHFSSWLLINNVLTFFMHRTTDLVLGRALGSGPLGVYNVAYEISNLPTTELVFPVSRAVFPGYSKMASNIDELRRAFLDVLSVVLLVVAPAGLGIASVAEPLVHVMLGEKWLDAVPLIQVLGVFGVLRASSANSGAMYLALGVPRLLALMTTLFLVMMGLALWVLVPAYGTLGAAFSMLFASATAVPAIFVVIARRLGLSLPAFLSVVWRPACSAVIMAGAVTFLQQQLVAFAVRPIVQLAVLSLIGAAIYLSCVLALWRLAGRPRGGETYLMPLGTAVLGRIKQRLA